MGSARVRSLYDAEAVLRQAAGSLRALGWSDPANRFTERVPSEAPDLVVRRELALARHASLIAALRRSREILDAVARVMDARAAAQHTAFE